MAWFRDIVVTASDCCRSEQEIIVPTDAVHNAKVQLTATLINNVAAAFIVAGFVAPIVNSQFTSADLLWIIIGVGLHAVGRTSLGSVT